MDIITVHDKLTRLPLFHLISFALMEGVASSCGTAVIIS